MKRSLPWGILLILILLVFYPQHSQFASTIIPKMNSHLFNKEIHLELPTTMQVVENWVEDREQLHFSAYINDEHYALRGYIQIWQISELEDYLHKSKEMSTFDFYTYSLNATQVNELQGFVNIWGASFGQLTRISGKEYWLNTPNHKVVRIAFLTNDTNFNEEQLKIIGHILSSLNPAAETRSGETKKIRSDRYV